MTLEERKTALLIKAYKAKAEQLIGSMKSALANHDTKGAARIGLYLLVPTIKKAVDAKNNLRTIRKARAKAPGIRERRTGETVSELKTGEYIMYPNIEIFVNRRG